MKKTILLFLAFFLMTTSFTANCQLMVSIAGTGHWDTTGNGGPAKNAAIQSPWGLAVDSSGNVYLGDYYGNNIRRINTNGIIDKWAGTGASWPWNKGEGGQADTAIVTQPFYFTFDHWGNLYINEGTWFIRKISKTRIITTVTGDTTHVYNGDGLPATDEGFINIGGIATDKHGNIFVADAFNNKIRKIDNTGIMTTYAGGGSNSAEGIPATDVAITVSNLVIDDSDNMFFTNGQLIMKIDKNGIYSIYAGDGIDTSDGITRRNALTNAKDLAISPTGELYFCENYKIRKISKSGVITTVVGKGVAGYGGDSVNALQGIVNEINNLTFDRHGNLYFNDEKNAIIWKVYLATDDVASVEPQNHISISPNPGTGIFNLKADGTNQIGNIRLINSIGKTILQRFSNSNSLQIDLSKQPNGNYILEEQYESGKRIRIQKIVKIQ